MIDPHCPIGNTSTHDLFNELTRRLHTMDDDDGGNVMYRHTANMVDTLHHAYTDFEDISEQAARDLHA